MAGAEALSGPGGGGTAPAGRIARSDRRHFMSAGHALLVGLLCFSLWVLFDARQLYNSAYASPLGVRRSVAMSILRPVARFEEFFGFDRIVDGGNRALGRTGINTPGGVVVPPNTLPSGKKDQHHPKTPKPPVGPRALTTPTVARPMTILQVGDSIGEDLGLGLADVIGTDPRVHLLQDAVGDTGLSNMSYFDWPATLEQEIRQVHPQLVVVMLGGNDWQGFLTNGQPAELDTHLWVSVYTHRVDQMMAEATAAGAHVLWVGLPVMSDPSYSSHMAFLNSIYRQQARRYPGVVFIGTWKLFSNSSGRYSEYLPDKSGNLIEVRDDDGVHIDPPGGTDLLGSYVLNRIEGTWHIKL